MRAKGRKPSSSRKRNRTLYVIAVLFLLILVCTLLNCGDAGDKIEALFRYKLPDPSIMRVTMLNVGQGDSIWLTSGGKSVLIDAGENSYGAYVARYLKLHGVSSLDAAIGTHPHSDHIGGLDKVIDTMPVGTLYMPDIDYEMPTFQDVIDAAEEAYVDITIPDIGDHIKVGDMELTFLHPDAGEEFESLNDYSVCVLAEHPYGSVLLTGDAGNDVEAHMIDTGLLKDVDILKAGHHGSSSSTSDALLDAITPEYVLISCGAVNDYGHPHRETIQKLGDRGIAVYRTDKDGTITIDFTEGGITVTTN